MKTIDKLKIIEGIPHEGAVNAPIGNQSNKTTYTCGCTLVAHGFAGKPAQVDDGSDKYEALLADRRFFVTLCKTHESANN